MIIRTATGLIAWHMKLCGTAGWASFWRTIYVLPGHENNRNGGRDLHSYQSLLRHERCHLEQIDRDGRLLFLIRYLYWLARHGYWNNPYEVEARAAERFSS